MIVSEVIAAYRRRTGDYDGDQFTDAELVVELNDMIVEIATDLEAYVTQGSVQLSVGVHIYTLPQDCERVLSIVHDDFFKGRVILHSSYNDILATGQGLSDVAFNSPQNWGFSPFGANSYSNRSVIQEISSANEFAITPPPTGDEAILYNSTVYS